MYASRICLLKYQQPEIMGLDAVYVNIYDKYFATGEMSFWVNDKMAKNLEGICRAHTPEPYRQNGPQPRHAGPER